jgi:hypothetical protein
MAACAAWACVRLGRLCVHARARARACVRAFACVRACECERERECECECECECERAWSLSVSVVCCVCAYVCVRHRSESVNRSNVTIGDCDAKGTALGNWAEAKLALGEIIPADEYKNTRSGRKY